MTAMTNDVPVRPTGEAGPRRMPVELLEARIVELSSQIAGATCELLRLVGDFDVAEAWRPWGMRSTAHWLSWKCGVGMSAAREQVRVARALRHHPRLLELFRAGRLSYSKVRSITRVADAGNLDTLIEWALSTSAAELERIVAAYRRCGSDGQARARRAARTLSYRWDDEGNLVGSFRLPPDEAAVFLSALEVAKSTLPEPIDEVAAAEDAAVPACDACRDQALRRHENCTGGRAHRGFHHVDPAAEDRSCAELASLQARRACPEVDAPVLAAQRRGRSQADALVRLADLGRSAAHESVSTFASPPGLGEDRFAMVLHVSAESSGELADGRVNQGPPLPGATVRRLVCGCPYTVQTDDERGNPLHLGRKTRRISRRLARAVHHRDGGRCRAPGCDRATTQIHHVVHWCDGGKTCIDNLISLCDGHHWLVHEGGWQITTIAAGRWLFQRPDGATVPRTGSAPPHLDPLPEDQTIAGDAITPRWNGGGDATGAADWLARRREAG